MPCNVRLHSAYNPEKEAERYVSSLNGSPYAVVITEPAESYTAAAFRKKFPAAKLIALRFTDSEFADTDYLWDAVWRPSSSDLVFFLLNNIPEQYIAVSAFLSWKPSEKNWPDEAQYVWEKIAEAVNIAKSVIATRAYFGNRWLKNISYNILFLNKVVSIDFDLCGNSFFAASGPSLKVFLNKNQNCCNISKTLILAASSALSALLYRNVCPLLCISTDGGFWAGRHFKNADRKITAVFPFEAFIPIHILKNNPCALLNYGSALEVFFFEKLGVCSLKAKRNGTVSGTAIELLLEQTQGKIFLSGLDLKKEAGFSHTMPNSNLQQKIETANRLYTIEALPVESNLDMRSIEMYAAWFRSLPQEKSSRLYRIGNLGCELNNIQQIPFEAISSLQFSAPPKLKQDELPPFNERKNILLSFYNGIKTAVENGSFFESLSIFSKTSLQKEIAEFISFSDYVAYIKEKNNGGTNQAKLVLKKAIISFIEKETVRIKDAGRYF